MSDQIEEISKELLPKVSAYGLEFEYTPKYVAIDRNRTVWVTVGLPVWQEDIGYYQAVEDFSSADEVIVSESVYQLLRKHKIMEIVA
ncbi:MAG: hypothetical protein KAG37_05105 [Flavobacteriales bacterium]|nr:hypothetical protein [Flavobacteriales bacterium]